jgi:Rrf2 family transcriptional regulator, cysteine metabolism repressor
VPFRAKIGVGMISITTKSPYALSALVELHHQGDRGPVPIAELARRRDIPVQFLEQLFATLRRAGVLRSQRGVKGGYSFARPAGDITVLELVELLDGPVGAGANGVFAEAAGAARSVLSQSTVADVADAESRAAGAAMYHI